MRRRIGMSAVAAVVALLALVAAGCGGGGKSSSATTSHLVTTSETTAPATTSSSGAGTVSTTDWSNGFCSAVSNWGTSIRTAGQALQGTPSTSSLRGAVAQIKNANQTLVASLKSLGAPDITGGSQVKASVDELATTLKTHSDAISSAMASVGSPGELRAAAGTLSANLIAMGTAFKSALTQLKSVNRQNGGSFKKTFDQAPACKKLKSQQQQQVGG
jgi:hypothetical protein